MARFHPLGLSDTHTRFGARTSLTVVSLLNFYQNLCLLPNSSQHPSFLPSQTKVSARQTDNQTGAQSMHKISTHTRRQTCMMCRRHLPRQPNNEPTLTLIAILFICWQARKRRPTMLSPSSFPLIFSAPCINISALEHASLFPLSGFRIIYLSRLPTKANNWDSISVITINRSSSQCILLWL